MTEVLWTESEEVSQADVVDCLRDIQQTLQCILRELQRDESEALLKLYEATRESRINESVRAMVMAQGVPKTPGAAQ